jgi:aspartyl-tRNA(Asn)/glutamyl-tRNA(Gln) amidotransferase subunit B
MHLKWKRIGTLGGSMNNYEPVVGMEIHVELKTKSKMFCGCKNDPFAAPKPNIYTCPTCLAMPGGLPVPNKQAIEWTIKLGLALGSDIPLFSKFDRKHYFYPDLPKGYQISQYDQPLVRNGLVRVPLGDVRIHRVHLEEDTARNQHKTVGGKKVTLVDFNRGGVPLMEIVTEPDIHSGEHARQFLKKLHQIIRYLDISDADMEKGSMRLEPNISVRKAGETHLPIYKVEVKNINSFAFVKKAIEYETTRHIPFLEKGENPPQETRGWNEDKGVSFPQRTKENAADYRYFPDPDIPPMVWERSFIEQLGKELPELPDAKKDRFVKAFDLSDYDAEQLTDAIDRATYFEACVKAAGKTVTPKAIANWLINKKVDIKSVAAADLVAQIQKATTVEDVSDEVITKAIEGVLTANEKAVTDFKSGKETVKMFLFGTVLRELKGKGDKKKVMELLENALK